MYKQMGFDNDRNAIAAFFSITKEERKEKIKVFSKKWREHKDERFDEIWEKMKKTCSLNRKIRKEAKIKRQLVLILQADF